MKVEEFTAKIREAILAQEDEIKLVEECWGEPALDGSRDIECGCPLTFLIRHLFGAETAFKSVNENESAYRDDELAVLFGIKEGQLHSFHRGFDNRFDDDDRNEWWLAGNGIRKEFFRSQSGVNNGPE